MAVFRQKKVKGFKLWQLVFVVTVTVMAIVILVWPKSSAPKVSKKKQRHVDPSTMALADDAITALKEKNIYPKKSRGATIFTDESGRATIPGDDIIDQMKYRDLEEMYHRYLETIQVNCNRQLHLGSLQDGGYDICDDAAVAPSAPCVVYSFGVRTDFSFDDEISNTYGCNVHSFDPANGMLDHSHSPMVKFHATGLGEKDGFYHDNWRMRTLDSIKKELGHEKVDILKIDIEAGEWLALPDILSRGSLDGVKQLIMELHSWVDLEPWSIDHRNSFDYKQHLKVLRQIYEEGFRIFYFKRFPAACCIYTDDFGIERDGCLEVQLMRVNNKVSNVSPKTA